MKEITSQIVVIGAGPAGYVAAIAAAQGGLQTTLIDKKPVLGGTCLNEGCIPSKALLESSKHYYNLSHKFASHGIEASGELDFTKLMARKDAVVAQNRKGLDFLMKKYGVTVLHGEASFISTTNLTVTGEESTNLRFEKAIIATGSEATEIPTFAFEQGKILSSKELLEVTEVPKKLLILGAGVIGLELGSFLNRLGTKVEIIELKDRLLPEMDEEVSKDILRCLKKQKIKFHFKSKALTYTATDQGIAVKILNGKGQEVALEADKLLIAVGRKPNTQGLGLNSVGITTDNFGFIGVNSKFETSCPNIFAIGDVTQGAMLAHRASDDATQLVDIILGKQQEAVTKLVPSVIYTSPEAASVGSTEQELVESGQDYKKGVFPLRPLGRALASGEQDGFAKLLSDTKTGLILGVHLVGERATDLISEVVLAMEQKITVDELTKTIHPHPSYAESIKEAGLVALGHSHHL